MDVTGISSGDYTPNGGNDYGTVCGSLPISTTSEIGASFVTIFRKESDFIAPIFTQLSCVCESIRNNHPSIELESVNALRFTQLEIRSC